MTKPNFIQLPARPSLADDEIRERSAEFLASLSSRRTVRDFSLRPVSRHVIEHCIHAASSAPSGANMQPWHFAAVGDAPR